MSNKMTEGWKNLGQCAWAGIQNNKAHIFTALGMGGTILTGVLSAKDGAKAARKIDQKAYELQRPLTAGEKIQLCWKDFIDAALAGTLTCFSDFKSDQINTRKISEQAAIIVTTEKAYEKLSRKTREVLGEKKAQQVKDEIAKEKIQESKLALGPESFKDAPKVGNGSYYPFVDGYSNLPFWSNADYVDACVMKLRDMMNELMPRGDAFDYYDKIIGVAYSEWLSMIGYEKNVWNTPERKFVGWNKGYAKDGSEDDPIEIYRTTMEWAPGFAVTVLNWEKDPVNMKLGRLLKSDMGISSL